MAKQKWEYCVFTAHETSEASQYILAYAHKVENPDAQSETRLTIMDRLGRDGWELVAVHPLATGLKELYFKRAK